jgi:hypothetical protein
LEAALRKLSMDAKVIQAGRFDNKTTADVRRQLLEELVQKDQVSSSNVVGNALVFLLYRSKKKAGKT